MSATPSILEAARAFLVADAAVAAIVADRVHYERRPTIDAQACLLLRFGSESHRHHLRGYAGWATGFCMVDAMAPTPLAVHDLMDLCRQALSRPEQSVPLSGGRTLDLGWLKPDDDRPISLYPDDGAEQPALYGRVLDVRYLIRPVTA